MMSTYPLIQHTCIRQIKSMQMFKRQVQTIMQGDRAGVCVSNLDSKLLERGVASTPGAIQLWKGGIALVRKIKYYPGDLPCGSKFHVRYVFILFVLSTCTWRCKLQAFEYGVMYGMTSSSHHQTMVALVQKCWAFNSHGDGYILGSS